jgi:excisionase family DNA binding protein
MGAGRQTTRNSAPLPADSGPPDAARLFTPADAAAVLAVPESWLRRKAGRRLIPSTFLGKHLRFSAADLAAIVDAGSRPARSLRNPRRAR